MVGKAIAAAVVDVVVDTGTVDVVATMVVVAPMKCIACSVALMAKQRWSWTPKASGHESDHAFRPGTTPQIQRRLWPIHTYRPSSTLCIARAHRPKPS